MLLDKNWNVGGGLIFHRQILEFAAYIQDYFGVKERFIRSVFDSHAGLLWNGGRHTVGYPFTVEESIRRVRKYNSLGIGFNITFSNSLLESVHLKDRDCNWFLEMCEDPQNGVIVASELLAEHVRKRFPRYRLIASIGFQRRDYEFYREAQERYDLVVLHPDLNRDYDFIARLRPSRLEILANEFCSGDCPFRKEHNEYISRLTLERRLYVLRDDEHCRGSCLARERGVRQKESLVLSFEEVDRLYDLGIRHFKIQGREHPFEKAVEPALKSFVGRHTMMGICKMAEALGGIESLRSASPSEPLPGASVPFSLPESERTEAEVRAGG